MCGICGYVGIQEDGLLERMAASLAHRGPDSAGYFTDGDVGLGHRRLSIIDVTGGQQPMYNEDGSLVLIANGEVYNYIELKEELEKKGYSFFSRSDTEVIVAAYDCWKEECVDHFDGMFAFAVWDEKEKELFVARDRFGEKPLFCFLDNEQFVFASEMKALWAAGIERKVNLKLLFNYLTIGYVDNPNIPEETFFENISKLPAASYLKLSTSNLQLSITNYWDIEVENENKKINDAEAIEQFGSLLQRSVKRRLRSDVPVGTSLSGGLDSSSIIATLHSLTAQSSQLIASSNCQLKSEIKTWPS
jgi:asparagine synthase (glutamine-hydrolysing)